MSSMMRSFSSSTTAYIKKSSQRISCYFSASARLEKSWRKFFRPEIWAVKSSPVSVRFNHRIFFDADSIIRSTAERGSSRIAKNDITKKLSKQFQSPYPAMIKDSSFVQYQKIVELPTENPLLCPASRSFQFGLRLSPSPEKEETASGSH